MLGGDAAHRNERRSRDASELVAYVVTELVNNAIDHSSGRHVKVSAVEESSRP